MAKRTITELSDLPLATDAPARALVLRFAGAPPDVPDGSMSLIQQRAYFATKATEIVDLFYSHLPGGLTDAIFGELAHRKASVFQVSHDGVGAVVKRRRQR